MNEIARKEYLSWDEYFMAIVKLASMRSKDPSTQVGAIIVNDRMQIIATGYNGFPRGIDNDAFPWNRENSDWKQTKYPYVVHAEANAIINASHPLMGTTIYVSLFPCNECAKLIIQAGIKTVYFTNDKYNGTPINDVAKKVFDAAKIEYKKLNDISVEVKKEK